MGVDQVERLDRDLAAVAERYPEDVAWLRDLLRKGACQLVNAIQRNERDAIVRECFALLGWPEAKPAARRIEHELRLWIGNEWNLEGDGVQRPDPPGFPGAIRRLARANGGEQLRWRQLLNIAAGTRSPISVQ